MGGYHRLRGRQSKRLRDQPKQDVSLHERDEQDKQMPASVSTQFPELEADGSWQKLIGEVVGRLEQQDEAVTIVDAALKPSGLYRKSYRGSVRKLESSSARDRMTEEWCAYHQVSGHDTGKCRALQHAVAKLITTGKTIKAQRSKPSTIGEVGKIAGGFSGGGITSAARKRYLRTINVVAEAPFGFQHPDITFSPADFFGLKPHLDDPIVISLRVNNFDVQRTLLDQGSSADIIYGGEFTQLGIGEGDLIPYKGTLVGFAGE
ncbi:uncharacterized protein LOC130743785 [Lotus japonicus]|uniref:uncharacterized protein LOC130743785 n=1 Tax=Lotus japonicus TaxID=34305 RepID=UPI0025881618|nr:uncharacterized protein LOC130743785 [Lotus japonicus]